jgi:hypothetical protein
VARRDLSRTVIEGGRARGNKDDRRASHGEERAYVREWLGRVACDNTDADDTDPRPRRVVYKHFRDKLGPAKRWLASQVGRPWSNVFSDLCTRFDTRTIAGHHVVHSHLLGWVYRGDESQLIDRRGFEFVVDAHGILRRGKWCGRSYYRMQAEALQWAANRRAALTFRGWWWFRREAIGACCVKPWLCNLPHHHDDDPRRYSYHGMRMVSVCPLTRGDLRRLDRMPDEIRAQLVIAAPIATGW